MAYSGSIAMISVLGTKLTDGAVGGFGMSATIGIGHLITAGTMMWIHSWRIGQLDRWIDSERELYEEDDGESEEVVEESEEVEDESIDEVEIELDIPTPITEDDEIELVDLD